MFLLTNGKVLWGAVIAAFILSIVFILPFSADADADSL
ncbi:hypothetical protein B4143_0233 [Bacillus subtilis]|nr:hypothetical protein B4143_0233 [Bacillus subtilis]